VIPLRSSAISAFIAVAACLCASGCDFVHQGATTKPAVIVDDGRPPAGVHGHINEWSWNIAAKALKHLTPAFNQRYPNIQVNVDMTGARMEARVLLALAAGVGAPDVTQFQISDAQRYISTGKLLDLTPVAMKYRDRFPKRLWANCLRKGHVYAIPWDTGPCAVYYKRDLFAKYGVEPDRIETWDDFIEAGKTIFAKSGGRTKMLAVGANGISPLFEILLQQAGGQVFDDEGRIVINSPQSAEVLALIKRMRESGVCSDVSMWSQEYMAGFNGDSLATYPMAVWFAGTIKDTVKDFAGTKPRWGVFRLPALHPGGSRVSNLGGSVLAIPAQCKNPQAAWRFIEYALCTVEGQTDQYRSMSLFPAYLPALKDPMFDEPDPFFENQKASRLFATDVDKIQALNRTPNWSEAQRYLDQAFSQWAASGMPNDGFFRTIEQKLHRRIGIPIGVPASQVARQ
jgi:lactose/L-arabinose transport system substrate-binding protein